MKRKLVAVAAMTLCGAAFAQSSVTVYGVVDVNYETVKSNSGRTAGITNAGGELTPRLGFRGKEDLGGGTSAIFNLEMGFNPNNGSGNSGTSANNQNGGIGAGALQFSRLSYVGLSGNWGELRLGRDYVPSYHALAYDDPVLYGDGVGGGLVEWIMGVQTTFRGSNMIKYLTPADLGGFYGKVAYAFNNRASTETFTGTTPSYAVGASTKDNGTYYGGAIGWKGAGLDVTAGWGHTKFAPGTATTSANGLPSFTIGNYTEWSFGGTYYVAPIPGLSIRGLYQHSEAADAGALGNTAVNKAWVIGPVWMVGPHTFEASVSRLTFTSGLLATAPQANKWSLGYKYNFSKRTYLYAAYGHVSNKNGSAMTSASASSGGGIGAVNGPANVNGSSSGFGLGLSHSF